jgi:Phytanoyl-CoA dioxygenase (PhyH)
MPQDDLEMLQNTGRLWWRGALDATSLARLDLAFKLSTRPGARLEIGTELHQALGPDSRFGSRLQVVLPNAKPVRVVAFDKTPEQNWGVPWHQDRVIAVKSRHDVPGYHNWSQKSGVWHCEPPAAVLEQMLFLRVHLDDADLGNGGMEIALGSHQAGPVNASKAADIAARYVTENCVAARGDVLVLNMLILHRSKPATDTRPRRVFRVDYGATDLPTPLGWAT